MAEMSSTMVASQDRHARIALDFLQNVLGGYHPRNFAVELWDGTTWEAETGTPLFTIVLKHPGALRRMFLPPNELTMGEAYIFGDFEVRGSLHDMMRLAEFLLDEQEWGLWQQLSAAWSLLRLPTRFARCHRTPRRARWRTAFHHAGPPGHPLSLRCQQRVLFPFPR